jgi:ribosomal protein L11 methylase PrmA
VINDFPNLVKHLNPGGIVLVSGFYFKEYEEVKRAGESAGLTFVYAKEKNEWAMVRFVK